MTSPYPDPATIYRRSAISDPEDDMFEDIYLADMWVYCLLTFDVMLMICHRCHIFGLLLPTLGARGNLPNGSIVSSL
jgi:hypothetical protein